MKVIVVHYSPLVAVENSSYEPGQNSGGVEQGRFVRDRRFPC